MTRSEILPAKILRSIVIVSLPFLAFWLIIINRSPNILRPISMLLRTGYTLVVPFLFLAFYLAFRLKGWLGYLTSLLLTLSVFALALAGVWASSQTESGILSGVVPMFDSASYYSDALRLLAGEQFSELSTRRPFFSAFFAVLLWITSHNLLFAHAILTLLVAFACYFFASLLNESHGPIAAAFALVVIFIYYRFHSGAVRTENLGVLFGVLGAALNWHAITKSQPSLFLFGILLTSIGMIARAGAFFVLPLLVFWGAYLFRQKGKLLSWKLLVGGILSVAIAFLANQWFFRSFGASEAVPFGNFSYSFYGLASGGKSWAHVVETYPEAGYNEIYKMAFQLILEKPSLFIQGVTHNYSMFFSNTAYGLYSYMGGEGQLSSIISYFALLILSGLGILNWLQNRTDSHLSFVMISSLGLLLSVPFLPPTDAFRLRAYATSVVILALLPSMGLHWIITKLNLVRLNPKNTNQTNKYALLTFSIVITAAVILGPFASKGIDSPPELATGQCDPDATPILVRYEPSAAVHFVSQNVPLLDWAPTFHISTLHSNIHDFPNFAFMDWVLSQVSPGSSLFYTLDSISYQEALVLIPSVYLPAHTSWLELCGTFEEKTALERFNIYYAASAFEAGN